MKASASVLNGWNCASKLRFLCFELQLTLNTVHSTPPKIHATDSIAGEWKSHKHTVFFPLPDDWHGVACDCVFICHSMLPLLFSPYSMWTTETNMWYWNRSSIYPFLTQCVAASKSILFRCSRSTFIRFKYGVEFGLCVPSKSYCVPYFDLFAFSISFVRSLFPYH